MCVAIKAEFKHYLALKCVFRNCTEIKENNNMERHILDKFSIICRIL